jgi:hypothetical protein
MAEYLFLVIPAVGLMFYLIHLAFHLGESYDSLKIFLILISLIMGCIVTYLVTKISEAQALSSAIQIGTDMLYYVWTILTFLVLVYFVIYLIVRAFNAASEKNKLALEGDTTE